MQFWRVPPTARRTTRWRSPSPPPTPLAAPPPASSCSARVDERGFVFYTNYQSRKGTELQANPFAALCCYWPWIDEQVRVEGRVEPVSEAESDEYFAGRPRGSQIGAWASDQSRVRVRSAPPSKLATNHCKPNSARRAVPRPRHWGGYRITPDRIEFWKAGTYRLHQRHVYVRDGAAWRVEILYP